MTRRKHATHECCPNAKEFLQGYPRRSAPDGYNWHLIGLDRWCIYCPWCGGELEKLRIEAERAAKKLRIVSEAE